MSSQSSSGSDRRGCRSLFSKPSRLWTSRALLLLGSPCAHRSLLCQFLLIPQTFKRGTAAGLSRFTSSLSALTPLVIVQLSVPSMYCGLPKGYLPPLTCRLESPTLCSISLLRCLKVISDLKWPNKALYLPPQNQLFLQFFSISVNDITSVFAHANRLGIIFDFSFPHILHSACQQVLSDHPSKCMLSLMPCHFPSCREPSPSPFHFLIH